MYAFKGSKRVRHGKMLHPFLIKLRIHKIMHMLKVFGKHPRGERLKRIERSSNYKNGSFQNIEPTEVMAKDFSFIKMLKDYFNKPKLVNPPK